MSTRRKFKKTVATDKAGFSGRFPGLPKPVHWELPGILAYGHRPGFPSIAVSDEELEGWLVLIRKYGIRSIINLLTEEEEAVYYRRLSLTLSTAYRQAGLNVRSIGDNGGKMASPKSLRRRAMEVFSRLPKPVLVHCSTGTERAHGIATYIRCASPPPNKSRAATAKTIDSIRF